MSYVVFEAEDGGVDFIFMAPGVSPNAAAVPDGARWAFADALPDRGTRHQWVLDENGQIVVDENREAVMPSPTPLQIVEEIESRPPLSDGTPMIDRFLSLMTQLEQIKFASARNINHDDPRIARFGPALELDEAGVKQLLRDAASR